jgi:glucose-inhibited division protein A
MRYDVVVIGGGHAGCEAALAAARLGMKTCLFTMNLDTIAQMSCNPAIGGLAKGHLVREIDALGGEMAKATDRAGIQFRVLNRSKGPAVWSLRAQCDRVLYRLAVRRMVEEQEGLLIKQAQIENIEVEKGKVRGVRDALGVFYPAGAVVVTTGTFLNGLMHIGLESFEAGRAGGRARRGVPGQGPFALLDGAGPEDGEAEDRHTAEARRKDHRFYKDHAAVGRRPAPAIFLQHRGDHEPPAPLLHDLY